MPAIAWAFPILPDKLDAWKRFVQEMAGPRRSEHEASRRRMGVSVEWVWPQPLRRAIWPLCRRRWMTWLRACRAWMHRKSRLMSGSSSRCWRYTAWTLTSHYLDRCRNWSSTGQGSDGIAASAAATARGDSTTSISLSSTEDRP